MNSQLSWGILKRFSSRNTFGFTLQDVAEAFPGKNRVYLARILAEMVEKGMLFKIAKNIYHILPLNADSESYIPDGHQIAKYLMLNKEYYIGYNSALRIHGISSQSDKCVFVVTKRKMKQAFRRFEGIDFHFIVHSPIRFFGFESMWGNHLEKLMVSDLEKTIVDMAVKPHLCGGIMEVGDALYQSKDQIDYEKLIYYLGRNMNRSARKRILFLTDILGLEWTTGHDEMMEELGSGISILDPSLASQGKKLRKFGLNINVSPAHIRKKVLRYNNGIPGSYIRNLK